MALLGYIFAILPAAVLAYFAIRQLVEKPVPWILLAIGAGMFMIIPSFQFEQLEKFLASEEELKGWPLFTVAFGLVGLGEEVFKGLALLIVAHFSNEIINIKRGIVYGILVAMGFALVENIIYAYIYPLSTILVRSFTAVPAHAVFAIIVGYFLGLTYSSEKKNWGYFSRGILFASLLHGAYDWFILQNYYESLTGGAIVILCLGFFYAYWLIQFGEQRSVPLNPTESPGLSSSSLPDEIDSPDDLPVEKDDV